VIIEANVRKGNRGHPVVHGFRLSFCADPKCGPHFLLLDRDDKIFAEMVMTADQICDVEAKTMSHLAGLKP
jgi:hypothetical protein